MRNAIAVAAVVVLSVVVMGNVFAGEKVVPGNTPTQITVKATIPSELSVKLSDTTLNFGNVSASATKEAKIDITIVKSDADGNVPKMKVQNASNLKSSANKTISTQYGLRLGNSGTIPYKAAASFNDAGHNLKKSGVCELWGKITTNNTPIGTYTNVMTVTFSQTL